MFSKIISQSLDECHIEVWDYVNCEETLITTLVVKEQSSGLGSQIFIETTPNILGDEARPSVFVKTLR